MLEEMRQLVVDECDIQQEFSRLQNSERTIAILKDRWWSQTAKQDGNKVTKEFHA